MITKILNLQRSGFARVKIKDQNQHQRQKYYSKYPQIFRKKTLIRPPDLTQSGIQFPITIPIRFRHIYKPTKPLFIDNSSKIHWNRLSPNETLLGLEHVQYLSWEQLVEGLQTLSKAPGQEKHDWNEHPWVKQAFGSFHKQFNRIKKTEFIRFYHLMKKLNNKDEQLWKKIYAKLQQYLYDWYAADIQMLLLKYYQNPSPYFSEGFKQKLLKIAEGRIRQFKAETILKLFEIYLNQKRLNTFYIESVFAPLFKSKGYDWSGQQIGKIFRFMMIVGHQTNERLYNALYQNILTHQYKSKSQVDFLFEVIEEVKEIFPSHRVEEIIDHLEKQKETLKNKTEVVKKGLHEIVKEDLIYFMEKRRIKSQSV